MKFTQGLSSLFFLTVPLMFELPNYVTAGFIILFTTSVLYHVFPDINLFRMLDTSAVIYVCSTFTYNGMLPSLILTTLNMLEKIFINTYSSFILSFTWIYTIIYCSINYNKYTFLPIIFSSLSYYHTYYLNKGKWNNMMRLIWHFHNTIYISINVPFRFSQSNLPEIPIKLLE